MFFVIPEMPSKTFVMVLKKLPDHFKEVDNDPDLTTAVDLMDVASGTDVDLEEGRQI